MHNTNSTDKFFLNALIISLFVIIISSFSIYRDNPKIIPFRDSKLTRLFQNFFCGQGHVNMIVNVNQCASMFDETLHVFKFSAIAKQVNKFAGSVNPGSTLVETERLISIYFCICCLKID